MVIDTSAIIAILRGEPEAERLQQSIATAPRRRLSAASLLECRIVAANLGIGSELNAWLGAAAIVTGRPTAAVSVPPFRTIRANR